MPWSIICLQEFYHKTGKLDCGANDVFFNAPKMLGALRARAFFLKPKHGKINERNRWRIQIDSHRDHHQQYTKDHRISTSSTQATSTRSVRSNTGSVTHEIGKVSSVRSADGHGRQFEAGRPLRVGYAVPRSDMTAGDEERETFFVNFMAKHGLVAPNSWTPAPASQEEMHTRNEWDEQEIMGSLSVGRNSGGLLFDIRDSQSQMLQNRGKQIHEHGPQNSFLRNRHEK